MTATDTVPETGQILQARQQYASRLEWAEVIRRLSLERNAFELDAYGFTVVDPDVLGTRQLWPRARDALLEVASRRTGAPHHLGGTGDVGAYPVQVHGPDHYVLFYLLFEDQAFEEWLENDVLNALVRYVMRGPAHLSSLSAFVKWQGDGYGPQLGLHADSPVSPEGRVPDVPTVCNSHLVLTDYTEKNGALAVVPGSHHLARQPLAGEGVADAVPVEAPAGSLILWHGGLWHGAYPKRTPGLRLNLTTYFCAKSVKEQERYAADITPEVLARRSRRFAALIGLDGFGGWTTATGPDLARAARFAPEPDDFFR